MSFEIRQASRQGVKPLVGMFGESGTGKTMSALLLARGLVGPSGKIVMLDTESGRGSLYADVIAGGYQVLELREPFSPARYIEAIQAVEASGANVLVCDSASHEWEGLGGVTDAAADVSRSRAEKYNKDWDGVIQYGDWKHPKMDHQRFVLKLLQSPLAIIVCLRAKQKSTQTKGTEEMAQAGIIQRAQVGKTVIIKDDFTSPIQNEHFISEMMVYMEIHRDHTVSVIKHSHPTLRECFPKDKTTPITIEHGQALARWCASPGGAPEPKPKAATELAKLKKELWDITKAIHNGDKARLEQHCWDENLMSDTESLETLTVSRIQEILEKIWLQKSSKSLSENIRL